MDIMAILLKALGLGIRVLWAHISSCFYRFFFFERIGPNLEEFCHA